MKSFQSSLLLEAMESVDHGVKTKEETFSGGRVTTVELPEENPFSKPGGKYITIETKRVQSLQDQAFENAVNAVARAITPMIHGARVLVAALGNNDITPDSLGPKMMRHLMVTRPFEQIAPDALGEGKLRSVAAVCTNVYGATGIESAEMIRGVTAQIQPDTVIVIDALATTHLSRLCSTVQVADTGLVPGSGVANARKEVSRSALGVPVISVGMPTVMDGAALLEQVGSSNETVDQTLSEYGETLIAMPTGIGTATDNGAKLLAFALNKALHYNMSMRDMLSFLS